MTCLLKWPPLPHCLISHSPGAGARVSVFVLAPCISMAMLTIEATWQRPELRTNRRWRLELLGPGAYIIQRRPDPGQSPN